MAGLFDTFTVAKRGLNVQQGAINTTSHNIANANTIGYSRQRAVAETTRPFGGMSRFDSTSVGQVGTGAEITSIMRIRDSFTDYQVRSESGTYGYYNSMNETLSKVEDIFGEPSDSGIQELMSQFFSSFQEVSKSPDKSDVKTVAIKNASALADAINYTYNQLKKTQEDNQMLLQSNVSDVNSYLDQINEINKQIRNVSAVGQSPNDLMDTRDNLLDELSYKFGIKIDKDKFETIKLSSTEYPDSILVNSDPSDTGYNRLSYVKSATAEKATDGTPTVNITVEYYPLGNENSKAQSFTIKANEDKANELVKSLNQNRILIADKDGNALGTDGKIIANNGTVDATGTNFEKFKKTIFQNYQNDRDVNNVDNKYVKGEIAGNQQVQENISEYMASLDKLAAGLAYSVNAIQTGSMDASTSTQGLANNLIFVTDGATGKTDTGITAATIKINNDLIKDPTLLNCNTSSTSGEGDGARANAIANLNTIKMNLGNISNDKDLTTMNRKDFLNSIGIDTTGSGFKEDTCLNLQAGSDGSTVDSFYKTIINNIAVSTKEADRMVTNQDSILSNLEQQRLSVSGVSLDEEMTDLIQFQHAYQANAKMISTIDELLDVVINGLKR